jgi:predicted dinucleotide-binding enzyme
MPATIMVNPKGVKNGDHTIFVAGNDQEAKAQVSAVLKSFGWTDILDLGDVSAARGPEMYMAMWIRLLGALQHTNFNIKVQR